MSIWTRVRKLLRLKPTVAERVREMTAERVRVEQQRHELDKRVTALEAEEREVMQRGAAAATDVERKQLAGKLMRVRTDLRRVRSQENVYTQQINILGTHIHHLTLTEQGRRMELPKAEDLTREAAQAEQVLTELAGNADLARSIEVAGQTPLMAAEEAAILEEFKQMAATPAPAVTEAAKTPSAAGVKSAAPAATPAPAAEKNKARPEIG